MSDSHTHVHGTDEPSDEHDEHVFGKQGVSEAVDPVCGMKVTTDSANHVTHRDQTYYFCSSKCLDAFRAEPDRYARPAAAGFVALTRPSKIRRPQRMTSMMAKTKTPPAGIGKVLKRLHYPLDVILLCVRWYVAYSLSLRNLEEMMAERGIEVDHSSVHRWVIKLLPALEKAFRKRKRPVGKSWRVDETYVKVKGQWKYLYRAVQGWQHCGFPSACPSR